LKRLYRRLSDFECDKEAPSMQRAIDISLVIASVAIITVIAWINSTRSDRAREDQAEMLQFRSLVANVRSADRRIEDVLERVYQVRLLQRTGQGDHLTRIREANPRLASQGLGALKFVYIPLVGMGPPGLGRAQALYDASYRESHGAQATRASPPR
jgi:hypothetical protein